MMFRRLKKAIRRHYRPVLTGRAGGSNRIVGVIRFSVPLLTGFVKTPADIAAARAFLYDPERLERRFHWFERLTLPSLIAQTDGDFQLGVVIGEDLPAIWRDRLHEALRPLPGAFIRTTEPVTNYRATHDTFVAAKLWGAHHLTSFRLDDDDAMDRHFIGRLRRQADMMLALDPSRPVAIAQNRGFFLIRNPEGNDILNVTENQPGSCGTAMVASMAQDLSVYIENHRWLPRRFSTLSDTESPAFIRVVHGDNDSRPTVSGRHWRTEPDQTDKALRRAFGLGLTHFKGL